MSYFECPVVKSREEYLNQLFEKNIDEILTNYASINKLSIHIAAALLANADYNIEVKKYLSGIATKMRY